MNIPKHPTSIQLLRLLPLEELQKFATDSHTDYKAKKLTGMRMLCMMTCAFLETTRLSQRYIGSDWGNLSFAELFGLSLEQGRVSHSSISHRLDTMPVEFFEKSYSLISEIGEEITTPEERARHNLVRVDSSMVQDVLGKLRDGMTMGRKSGTGHPDRKQLKYTMAFDGFKVLAADIFTSGSYASEDLAIPEVVLNAVNSSKYHNEIYLFDRGVSSTQKLGAIDEATREKSDSFVGRLKLSRVIEVTGAAGTECGRTVDGIEIISDDYGNLRTKSGKPDVHQYRFIRIRLNKNRIPARTVKGKRRVYDDEVLLITNDFTSSALEIAGFYRRRWDIEVFFKFLKQNLSMAHLISSSENGLKIVLYMMLIVASLVMIYEKLNSQGPREAIHNMRIELMNWVFLHPVDRGQGRLETATQDDLPPKSNG